MKQFGGVVGCRTMESFKGDEELKLNLIDVGSKVCEKRGRSIQATW